MGRVLIIKFGAIGDVVMAIPAAYELHRRGHDIDWLCGTQVAPLLELYSWIRPIVGDDRALFSGSWSRKARALLSTWSTLTRHHYDLCATLYYDRRYRILSLPVRAARKVTLSHADRNRRLLAGRHHTDEYLRVLLGADHGPVTLGLAPVRPDVALPTALPRTDERPRIVLVPGGARNSLRSDALRRWPVESYVAVARDLVKRGLDVVLVGGPDDLWTAEAFHALEVTDLLGSLSLPETVALLDASDVVVTHDTGPLHLAGITRSGIVSIFGPTDPKGRLPQRAETVALWGGEGFACRPCYDGRDYAPCRDNLCVQQVTPDMVLTEIDRLLRQRGSEERDPPRIVTPKSTVTAGTLVQVEET